MSVRLNERSESKVQFIATARDLCAHTLKNTRKQFHKVDIDAVRFIRTQAMNILSYVVQANSIYPKTAEDVAKRYDLFQKAKAECYAMNTLLGVIKLTMQSTTSDYAWRRWGDLLNSEIDLLSKIMSSDENRKV